jgi:uncharacterized protein involved in response to NO
MKRSTFLRWVEEPYRLFFPLGIAAAVAGVMMWPLVYAGHLGFYPAEAHARMMVEGFVGAFVAGFLGTSFPRLTGNAAWSCGEFVGLVSLWLTCVIAAGNNHPALADGAFAGMLLLVFGGMAGRWFYGARDIPPPGFIMAFAGVAGGACAAAALAWEGGTWMHPAGFHYARLWLFQGFPLLPVLGIAPYLLPRFFGRKSSHAFETSVRPPQGWWLRAIAAMAATLLIAAGFVFETAGWTKLGHSLRAAVVLTWLVREASLFQRGGTSNTAGTLIRIAAGALVVGTLTAGFFPAARVGLLHVLFASGFGLIVAIVSSRVVLGHAGRHDLLGGRMVWLRITAGLMLLAAVTRTASDFLPAVRVSHHVYAAWIWTGGCLVWSGALGRHFLRTDESPESDR